jgi:hypothetical protein
MLLVNTKNPSREEPEGFFDVFRENEKNLKGSSNECFCWALFIPKELIL